MGRLDELDLTQRLARGAVRQARRRVRSVGLLQLRLHLGGQMGTGEIGPGLLVIFEGRDAGGKGGAIKRIVENLDPRHYTVKSFSAPTPDEKRHHFLWRFYKAIPGLGGMCVFDRSWYGRVLVERIEAYATKGQWTRAYGEIVEFERTLVLEGMILVKFWMHISDDEQLRRFERREADPLKRWKLTAEDWRNRAKNRRVRRGGRGPVREDRPRPRAVGHHRRRAEALRPRRRPRSSQRPHRGGHESLGFRRPRPRRSHVLKISTGRSGQI